MNAEEAAPANDEAKPDAAAEATRQRLAHLFRRCDLEDSGGPASMLFKAVLDHRLENPR